MASIDMEGTMCVFEDTEFKKARVIDALEAPARNSRTETLLPGGKGVTREGRGVKKGRKIKGGIEGRRSSFIPLGKGDSQL